MSFSVWKIDILIRYVNQIYFQCDELQHGYILFKVSMTQGYCGKLYSNYRTYDIWELVYEAILFVGFGLRGKMANV